MELNRIYRSPDVWLNSAPFADFPNRDCCSFFNSCHQNYCGRSCLSRVFNETRS